MERTPVKSSNVASVGYDNASLTMEVEFQNGSIYRYAPVAEDDYRALLAGEFSSGKFVNSLVSRGANCVRVCLSCGEEIDPLLFRAHDCAAVVR